MGLLFRRGNGQAACCGMAAQQNIRHGGSTAGGVFIRGKGVDTFRQGEEVIRVAQCHYSDRFSAVLGQCFDHFQLLWMQVAVIGADHDTGVAFGAAHPLVNFILAGINGGGKAVPTQRFSHHNGKALLYIIHHIAHKAGAVDLAAQAQWVPAHVRAACFGYMHFGNGGAQQLVIQGGGLLRIKRGGGHGGQLGLGGQNAVHTFFHLFAVQFSGLQSFGGSLGGFAGKQGGVGKQHQIHPGVHGGQHAVDRTKELLHSLHLKLTRHNGRAGTHGTYNPKHNDRSFNLANSEHIDSERAKGNIYWDCFHGFRSALAPPDPDDLAATFSDVERQFYESRYSNFVESQNERNAKIRHTERNRSIPDLLSSRKTCPEETIYQLGTLDEHASAEDLLNIVTEFIEEFKAKFGDHVHVLDWALHLDESTPHIHERHVFDCENKYGEVAPQQEKALETLGFELPDPDKPLSRRNNRKITFDAACRKMLFEIAKRHGLELEEEAEYGNRQYLEKQDFILAKQKEQLTAQQTKLDELTLRVNDMETLIDEVSAAAYDKAVEVVTDVVRTETRKEDMRMIEDTKKWVLSPERKAPQATREYVAHRLDGVLDKFLKTMQTTAARLQEKLLKPEVRQKGKEQVKEKARDSVLQLLSRLQAEQVQRNPSVLSTAEKSENRFQ